MGIVGGVPDLLECIVGQRDRGLRDRVDVAPNPSSRHEPAVELFRGHHFRSRAVRHINDIDGRDGRPTAVALDVVRGVGDNAIAVQEQVGCVSGEPDLAHFLTVFDGPALHDPEGV